MKVSFSKSFEKQYDKISDAAAKNAISNAIRKIIEVVTLKEIPDIKKLKGHKTAYRVRAGDYRIGFYFEAGEVFISAVAHRKDIYKFFP